MGGNKQPRREENRPLRIMKEIARPPLESPTKLRSKWGCKKAIQQRVKNTLSLPKKRTLNHKKLDALAPGGTGLLIKQISQKKQRRGTRAKKRDLIKKEHGRKARRGE